jgi:hypothetical protein
MRDGLPGPVEPTTSQNLEQAYLGFMEHAATRPFSEFGSESADLTKVSNIIEE